MRLKTSSLDTRNKLNLKKHVNPRTKLKICTEFVCVPIFMKKENIFWTTFKVSLYFKIAKIYLFEIKLQ